MCSNLSWPVAYISNTVLSSKATGMKVMTIMFGSLLDFIVDTKSHCQQNTRVDYD